MYSTLCKNLKSAKCDLTRNNLMYVILDIKWYYLQYNMGERNFLNGASMRPQHLKETVFIREVDTESILIPKKA